MSNTVLYKHCTCINVITYHYNHVDSIIPILQMRNWKHREAKKIAPGQQLGRDGARMQSQGTRIIARRRSGIALGSWQEFH